MALRRVLTVTAGALLIGLGLAVQGVAWLARRLGRALENAGVGLAE